MSKCRGGKKFKKNDELNQNCCQNNPNGKIFFTIVDEVVNWFGADPTL